MDQQQPRCEQIRTDSWHDWKQTVLEDDGKDWPTKKWRWSLKVRNTEIVPKRINRDRNINGAPNHNHVISVTTRAELTLVRLLTAVRADSRKSMPKNNIYTSKIIIPARPCWDQRHSFFIAIFLAFSGTLAEELMVFCRHVTTEL